MRREENSFHLWNLRILPSILGVNSNMKKVFVMLLALVLVLGLAACGNTTQNHQVVEVPSPEDMTLEFLQEHARDKGHHEWEGDIYLMEPYVFAVREDGEVECIFEGAIDVLEVSHTYVGQDRIPRSDGILVLNIHGYLMVGNSREGWVSRNP